MESAKQCLLNPEVAVTRTLISHCLKDADKVYEQFLDKLLTYGVSLMDWRYYNDGKAYLSKGEYHWTTSRGNEKAKPLFWLSIWEGFFKVSFYFPTKIQEELLTLKLQEETKSLIRNAPVNGKTKTFISVVFDVKTMAQLDDIYAVMQFKRDKV